jgi:MYXO-CTERM domain-containing protein
VVAQNQSVKNPRGFTMQTAADTRGAFSADLSIDKPGRHWVTVTGEQTGEAGTASVVVTGPPAAKPGKGKDLKVERAAATGSAPSAWGATGLGLLAAAGAAGAVALRRRHS